MRASPFLPSMQLRWQQGCEWGGNNGVYRADGTLAALGRGFAGRGGGRRTKHRGAERGGNRLWASRRGGNKGTLLRFGEGLDWSLTQRP